MTRHEVGDISWEVTDKYGHPVEKEDIRDARIDTLFGDKAPDFMYNICLSGNDDRTTMYRAVLNFREGKMDFFTVGSFGGDAGKELSMSFKCNSFTKADELISMIMEGNDLELTPASRSGSFLHLQFK
jgi:hypothetical protein